MPKIKFINKNRLNLYLDILLVVAFAVDLEYRFTGLNIHEWVGVVIGVVFLLHIVLHWQWILSLTVKFFSKLLHESRLRYLLNILLFADAALMVVSGILISRTLGFNFNVGRGQGQIPWQRLHTLSSEFCLVLVGLHVAIAWKWIANNTKKYLLSFGGGKKKQVAPLAVVTESAVVSSAAGKEL